MADRAARRRGQALVETAIVVAVILLPMVFGLTALGRVLHSQMAVSAIAREAARTGALASQPSDVESQGRARGYDVANGYHLSRSALQIGVDPTRFQRCGMVTAHVTYAVDFTDLPLLSWAQLQVHADDAEPVDGYRNNLPAGTC